MSRALNINAAESHVLATCEKKGIGISTIEALHSGGTRVVLNNADDTAVISRAYGSKILSGPVRRTPNRLNRR